MYSFLRARWCFADALTAILILVLTSCKGITGEEKPLKTICFFNTCKSWGGGEKWHYEIATQLSVDYQVRVAAFPGSKLSMHACGAGLAVAEFSIGTLSFLNPFKLWRLTRFFRRERISSVVLNLPSDLKAAGLAARLARVPQIVYRRGSAIPVRDTVLNRFLFRHVVTDIIANSAETKRTVLAHNPDLFPADRIRVIYNGIDLAAFDACPAFPVYVRRKGEVILGHAGRLSGEKNQKFLIDVVQELKSSGVKCTLLIAGKGPLESELRSYAASLGLVDEVVFLGFLHDIRSFMSTIDIFLLSSHWEGFGYVLVEAMAAAKPVVAFDSSSTPEVVEDQITGLLVSPGDRRAFAGAVRELVENCLWRKELGEKGRLRVEKVFDIRRTLAKVREFLE
jgi:glycosyltransferase involved in cell wall biosynthesis